MTDHEQGLKINYQAIRSAVTWQYPYLTARVDELWEIVKGTFTDPNRKCKCIDHRIEISGTCWRPVDWFNDRKKWATFQPMQFKYCPECGRKLQPNETL